MSGRAKRRLGLAVVLFMLHVGLVLPATRYGAAWLLLWVVPGLAWAGCFVRDGSFRALLEGLISGLGLGIISTSLSALLLHYIPGPVRGWRLLLLIDVQVLLLAFLAHRRWPQEPRSGPWMDRRLAAGLLAVLLLTILLRGVNLGYSQFQGDEAIVMRRAARAINGDGAQLFYHQKGPAEILVSLATWSLSGAINEWQARLPLAYAGTLGIVGVFLLGCRWFDARVGTVAGLLLAINGYFVAFGRIVQYQSLVLVAVALGLLATWIWSLDGERRWLLAGAAFLSFAFLAHYDAVLSLPAAAYMVLRRLWTLDLSHRRRAWGTVGIAVVLGALILASFYVPYVSHPNFAKTLGYLSQDRMGSDGLLYNNLVSALPLATFYNSPFYLGGLAASLVVASWLPFLDSSARPNRRRPSLLLVTILGYAMLALALLSGVPALALLPGPVVIMLLIASLVSPDASPAARSAWLWFGVPFAFYTFFVWDPRTHVLNAHPGAVILAGQALLWVWDRLHWRFVRYVVAGVGVAAYLFLAYYPCLMFVQHDPEVQRTWPNGQARPYRSPEWEAALFGYFGFPYQAGWKVVGALAEEGVLRGVFASNEEAEITDWYVPQMERSYCPEPDWYFIARDVQDPVPGDRSEIGADYSLWGEVRIQGQARLWIYQRGGESASPRILDPTSETDRFQERFDAHATPVNRLPVTPEGYRPAAYRLGESIRLVGYRLDLADAHPGGQVRVVLYWRALTSIDTVYQVFNHLYDGTMWGQHDGTTGCGLFPTERWEPGQVVRDEHVIAIDPAAPFGEIPLLVGMYELGDVERLPVYGPEGTSIGDAIPLASVSIAEE